MPSPTVVRTSPRDLLPKAEQTSTLSGRIGEGLECCYGREREARLEYFHDTFLEGTLGGLFRSAWIGL